MPIANALRRLGSAYASDLRLFAGWLHAHGRACRPAPAIRPVALLYIAAAAAFSPAAAPAPAAAQTLWRATVGAESGDAAVQALAFLPPNLTVNAGDTIRWSFDTKEPHTVTFNAPAGTSNAAPETCNGVPASTRLCVWDGVGFVNSGRHVEGEVYAVTFQAAGTFGYICLLHPTMVGIITVQPAGTPYPQTQAAYDQQAALLGQQLVAAGTGARTQAAAAAAAGPATQVNAGVNFAAQGQTGFLARFFARDGEVSQVRIGDTVTWTNTTRTPHTVTFGPEPRGNPAAPVNATGGQATIGADPAVTVNSGFFGDGFPGATSFRATFTAPGVYNYVCLLHDDPGMVGTVVVHPLSDGPGGRGLGVASEPEGVHLTWATGTGQTGYGLARLSNGTVSLLSASIDRLATSFTDSTAPGGLSCYLLIVLGTLPTAASDLECATRGLASPSGAPRHVTLRLNQSHTATLSWHDPLGPEPTGFLIVDLAGGTQPVGRDRTTVEVPIGAFSCFAIQALYAGAAPATSEVVCGQPGFSTLR